MSARAVALEERDDVALAVGVVQGVREPLQDLARRALHHSLLLRGEGLDGPVLCDQGLEVGALHSAISAGQPAHKQQGLLGGGTPQDSSAGDAAGYTPTGKIVADDGFRPDVNGFGVQN